MRDDGVVVPAAAAAAAVLFLGPGCGDDAGVPHASDLIPPPPPLPPPLPPLRLLGTFPAERPEVPDCGLK